MGKGGPAEYVPPPHQMSTSDPGVSTMPTVPLKVHPKPKLVTMAVAKVKRSSRESSPDTEMEKHESECNSDGNKTPPVMSTSVAAIAAMMEQSGEVYTGGAVKKSGVTGALVDTSKQLRVETKEHIYDQPQVGTASHSPNAAAAPHSPKPQVMPKPASPLHVATHHDPSTPSSGSPTGRSKKAPPPPPKRTHSIRSDTAPITKVDSGPAFSVTTTASVTASHGNIIHGASKQPVPVPNSHKQPPPVLEKPPAQTQAFASCVKSLSERFGKKSEMEGSQESLSSDSDEFPPPPPPIAMDIITPKIHNYGIPSRMDTHMSTHTKDYLVHSHQPSHPKDYSFQNRLKQPHPHAHPAAESPEPHVLPASASSSKRTSPARDVHAGSLPPERAKATEPNLYTSNLVDKRSESTTSFESTASSSSTDSNTLPFANENVGTIKQRAAVNKPSIIQTFDSVEKPATNISSGASMNSAHTAATSVNRSGTSSAGIPSGAQNVQVVGNVGVSRTVAAGIPQGMASASSRQGPPASIPKLPQGNQSLSDGSVRPPVPSRKPSQAPVLPSEEQQLQRQPLSRSHSQQDHQQQQQRPPSQQMTETLVTDTESNMVPPRVETGNVLSDIDNMLQDLTDELDAMLKEETSA
ncbi:hypothetical protein C0Q70_00255 [Pomacea canaliculata]|uniref:Uncharacterized protein n=1 Tax=Pomacea canaliculata TaxID=400727 RepID=A0A2T7PW90_POMCA|nr:hypothetical protein C0Q70_00255 [Pomacea canaliculata]